MIELINKLYIKVDQYNYTLQEKLDTLDRDGNEMYKNISYHDNLEKAIKGAISYSVRKKLQGEDRTLEEAIKVIKNINFSFEKVLKDVLERNEN